MIQIKMPSGLFTIPTLAQTETFALHEEANEGNDKVYPEPNKYSITHIPSGLCFQTIFVKYAHAVKKLFKIEELFSGVNVYELMLRVKNEQLTPSDRELITKFNEVIAHGAD